MPNNVNQQTIRISSLTRPRLCLVITSVLWLLGCMSSPAQGGSYQQVNLVSDLPGVALLRDTNLVNAWGISFSSASPFCVSDNGTGKATLYSLTNDALSKVGLE